MNNREERPSPQDCPGCQKRMTTRLPEAEAERILQEYLRANPKSNRASATIREARLRVCASCPDLVYSGTTCRHCGCLVGVRTWVRESSCPAPQPRWNAEVASAAETSVDRGLVVDRANVVDRR